MSLALVLIALVSAFFFALALVLTPLGLKGAGPLVGSTISVPTTAAVFLLLSPVTVDWAAWRMPGAAIFAATGLVFPAAVTLFSFASNRHIGPNLTGALGNLSPVFAIALAVAIFGDVPRPAQMAGLAAVVAGLSVLALERSRAEPGAAMWLLALPVAGALLRGGVQPVIKLGLESWADPVAAATLCYVVSAAVLWTVRLATAERGAPIGRAAAWYAAVGLSNGFAVLTLYVALSLGPVTIVAPIVASYPLATLLLDRLIHRARPLTRATVAGVTVSVAGIALILAT